MDYLFRHAYQQAIPVQAMGNPDKYATAGLGGVRFSSGAGRDTYEIGFAIPAVVAAGSPTATVGSIGSSVDGWTYSDVVKDAVDWIAWAQNEPATGVYRGGWRYSGNYPNSDNSVSQWPVIGLEYANEWGITPQSFVNTELARWVDYIQNSNPADYDYGGSGYTSPTYWENISKTGGLLIQHDYLGYADSDTRVQIALDYIDQEWLLEGTGSDHNFRNAYAMWSVYKGLEVTLGVNNETRITNLHGDPGDLDNPDHGWNWWEDYCEWLVNNQAASGAWTITGGYGDLWQRTSWYINILAATEIPSTEPPAPAAVLLGLLGLGTAGMKLRKRKHA